MERKEKEMEERINTTSEEKAALGRKLRENTEEMEKQRLALEKIIKETSEEKENINKKLKENKEEMEKQREEMEEKYNAVALLLVIHSAQDTAVVTGGGVHI